MTFANRQYINITVRDPHRSVIIKEILQQIAGAAVTPDRPCIERPEAVAFGLYLTTMG